MLGANITITLALLVGTSYVFCGMEFEVDYRESKEDMSLEGETFLNLTDTPVVHCFRRCFEDCRCMTFQMYKNTECQLLASTRSQKPTKLIPMNGYTYYEMKPSQQTSSCAGDINCCTTSSPCVNGGTCQPTSTSDHNTRRFQCVCTPNYVGQRCQYPTSCRGYKSEANKNGLYKIMDSNTAEIFTTYCDFDADTNFAWTLVSSYSLRNTIYFRYKALFIDLPINEYHTSWTKYRLSKSKMESIQRDSTKWRMTCEFQKTANITESDYVRVSMATANPITFDISPVKCVQVETIVVRGHRCSNCTAPLIQNKHYTLHFDCNRFSWGPCDFKPAGAYNCSEDNFGVYDCGNPAHRCSETQDSTTQIWFGGN